MLPCLAKTRQDHSSLPTLELCFFDDVWELVDYNGCLSFINLVWSEIWNSFKFDKLDDGLSGTGLSGVLGY